jgi:uncharacterized protein YdaU (DUF1376 family)
MTLPYYPFYWGDYSAKTFNLSVLQHGAYMLLLRHVYVEQSRVPDSEKYEICKAVTAEERLSVDYVLAKFWLRKNGVWWNERAEEIIEAQHKIHQANVIKGKKGGRPTKDGVKLGLSPDKVGPKQPEPEPKVIILDSARASVLREAPKQKPQDQFAILETQMREAAGWEREPHPNLSVVGPAVAAMLSGVDLDLDLLPACRAHGPKLTSRTSWKYILQCAISNKDNRIRAGEDASKPIQHSPDRPSHERSSKPEFIHPATVAANKLRAKLSAESSGGKTRDDASGWIETDYSVE